MLHSAIPEAHAIDAQLIMVGGGWDDLPSRAHAKGVYTPPCLLVCLLALPFAVTWFPFPCPSFTALQSFTSFAFCSPRRVVLSTVRSACAGIRFPPVLTLSICINPRQETRSQAQAVIFHGEVTGHMLTHKSCAVGQHNSKTYRCDVAPRVAWSDAVCRQP